MRLLLPAIFLLSAILSCDAQAQYPRPRRPERFDTAEQISNYLKELQEYYSVHGRGRFLKTLHKALNDQRYKLEPTEHPYKTAHSKEPGSNYYGKRQMHIADASVIFKEFPFFDHNLQNMNDETVFKALAYQ